MPSSLICSYGKLSIMHIIIFPYVMRLLSVDAFKICSYSLVFSSLTTGWLGMILFALILFFMVVLVAVLDQI